MTEDAQINARNEILEIKHLPPLSITANRLLGAIGNPDVEIDDLADIVSQDPGLMARIIGLANAAYFGQKNSITTVRDAIIRVLGINMVKSMALSIAISGAFQTSSCSGFDAKEYWFKAIGCATLSRMMALRIPAGERPDPDMVYLAGLLHNLGYLVLAHVFPSKLSHVLAIKKNDQNANLVELQREYLGVDWVSAGEWLVNRWHLPFFVGEAMRSVADESDVSQDRYDISIIRCAVRWIAGHPEIESEHVSLKQCRGLESIPGLGVDALDLIEEKFLDQCEELHTLAACL